MLQWEIFYTPTVYFHCSIHTLTLRPSYSSESIKFTVKLQWLNLGYCGKKNINQDSNFLRQMRFCGGLGTESLVGRGEG